jgi:hypothetical protein
MLPFFLTYAYLASNTTENGVRHSKSKASTPRNEKNDRSTEKFTSCPTRHSWLVTTGLTPPSSVKGKKMRTHQKAGKLAKNANKKIKSAYFTNIVATVKRIFTKAKSPRIIFKIPSPSFCAKEKFPDLNEGFASLNEIVDERCPGVLGEPMHRTRPSVRKKKKQLRALASTDEERKKDALPSKPSDRPDSLNPTEDYHTELHDRVMRGTERVWWDVECESTAVGTKSPRRDG